MASGTNAIPLVLGSLLGVMLAVLCIVLLLFYKKRKESIEFKPLERMTRSLKRMSKSVKNHSQKSTDSLARTSSAPQTPVLRDTQFWVPEVYNTIIQPSPVPIRKASRLQSTLDREIYSKVPDTSYLQAADHEVFDGDPKKSGGSVRKKSGRDTQRRLMSEPLNRGMLNFSLQYKADKAILYIIVIKAEGLIMRKMGEYCDPFVDIQVSPCYKRRMHSEVHQKTQNPVFNQQFEFEVPPYEICGQTVTFTVLDFNQQLAHESIGTVSYKLDQLDSEAFLVGKEFILWTKIDKDVADTPDKPDVCKYREFPVEIDLNKTEMLIQLSVRYLKIAERLTVNILKARNLLPLDKKGKLDHPYVSVSLKHSGRLIKKLRTAVVKHETNPVFNKSMIFEVGAHLIDEVTLTVKLRHHNEIGRDRTFAMIKIGKGIEGPGSLQWTDMLNSDESENVERWHCLIPIEPTDD